MDKLNEILEERGNDYGDFEQMANVAQGLKLIMGSGEAQLNDAQQESIDMMCTKLARIVCGNPNKQDTWRDIAGYATLIADILEKEKFQK